jgi:hypothetical protein
MPAAAVLAAVSLAVYAYLRSQRGRYLSYLHGQWQEDSRSPATRQSGRYQEWDLRSVYISLGAAALVLFAGSALSLSLHSLFQSDAAALVTVGLTEVAAVAAAVGSALLPRSHLQYLDASSDDGGTTASGQVGDPTPSDLLAETISEVEKAKDDAKQSHLRWFKTNFLLATFAALFSGAAGVTGFLESAPTTVRIVFASLALVGAAFTAANLTLGAGERAARYEVRANGLDALQRTASYAKRQGRLNLTRPRGSNAASRR